MKAVMVSALGDADVLKVEELTVPAPSERQVLIRVVATSVNFADVKARRGQYHGAGEPPFIPGLDAAGIVEAVGAGVTRFATGTRVVAFLKNGSYAEYVVADEALVYPIPDQVEWEAAAALPVVGFTAYALLTQVARLKAGESVLIHAAAGGVGTTAIKLANALGASQVLGVVSREDKVGVAVQAGAHRVVNSSQADFREAVMDMTSGRGVDVVLDSIGGTVAEESLRCLAKFGRLVHFGDASGQPGRIAVSDLHASCRSVLGFSLGTVRRERPALVAPIAEAMLDLVSSKRLTMTIGRHYPLSEAADAHRWIESRASTGKIILDVANPS